jgi:hypothetical protein
MSRSLLALPALITFAALGSAQGDNGFTRGQGNTDLALSYTLDWYDEFWVGSQKVSPADVGEIERTTYNLWAAHGLSEDLDLVASASYVEATSDGVQAGLGTPGFDDEEDLQDLVLGAKWRAHQGGIGPGTLGLLVAPAIKVPMTDYEENAVTAIGDGQVDLRFRGIVHYQIGTFWGALESGYDRRNGAPDDEIPINLTLGGNLGPVTIMPYYSQIISQGGIDIDEVPAAGRFPATEEEYQRYGISAYARLGDTFGLTAGYRTTSDGKNTGDVDAYTIGLVFNL